MSKVTRALKRSAIVLATVAALLAMAGWGEVTDMADAVVFLCSDAARFITGVGLPVRQVPRARTSAATQPRWVAPAA